MKKNTLVIAIVVILVVVGLVLLFRRGPEAPVEETTGTETLQVEEGLAPVELSEEELKALQAEGITPPSGDPGTGLQNVSSSDELGAIESDLSGTDLSGLDAESSQIESDTSGL